MSKHIHEIRDAVHVFDRLDSEERRVVDSRPFQRLRHIHQLAMTYLVYPGATHRRFEHSLGVMELAARVYSTIVADANRDDRVRDIFPGEDQISYWRRVLRMAALCHDIGHLPFSHAAEEQLLPDGVSHEKITVDLIQSPEMKEIWGSLRPVLNPIDIAKLAVGPKKYPLEYENSNFTNWERILAEIIVGDAFGVDRMDYLLRDSLHAGVVYGKFDQYRLIDTLRILPDSDSQDAAPVLGIEAGGLQSAEALALGRYFMYSQVYFHPIRRIYDRHLQDFLVGWFGKNGMPTAIDEFLMLTDDEVMAEIRKAERDATHDGYKSASRIVRRKHFKLLYERNANDFEHNPRAAKAISDAARRVFGEDMVIHDWYRQKRSGTEFPVKSRDGRIVQSLAESDVLAELPLVAKDFVFVAPEIREDAKRWLDNHREEIIRNQVNGETQ